MNDVEAALLRAVCDAPEDDTPRLIYADWLEERGRPGRAEFIRVQCELARTSDSEPRWQELIDCERALYGLPPSECWRNDRSRWQKLRPEWITAIPGVPACLHDERQSSIYWKFRRGFVEAVWVDARQFPELAEAILCMGPVRELRLDLNRQNLDALRSPHLADIKILDLGGSHYGGTRVELIRRLHGASHLRGLTELRLWGCSSFGPGGGPWEDDVTVLAQVPLLARLETLDLSESSIRPPSLRALLDSPYLSNVKCLNLSGTCCSRDGSSWHNPNIGEAGAVLLASHPAVARLTHLDLRRNGIRSPGAAALATSSHLANLQSLRLEEMDHQWWDEPIVSPLTAADVAALRTRFGDRLMLTEMSFD